MELSNMQSETYQKWLILMAKSNQSKQMTVSSFNKVIKCWETTAYVDRCI